MRFPPYPTDILSRADALLSSKYPDGIVDPRFVEVACEAMMAQREFDAKIAEGDDYKGHYRTWPFWGGKGNRANESELVRHCDDIAKAIRGTAPSSPSPGTTE